MDTYGAIILAKKLEEYGRSIKDNKLVIDSEKLARELLLAAYFLKVYSMCESEIIRQIGDETISKIVNEIPLVL